MTIVDVQNNTTFTGFSASDEQAIRNILTNIYNNSPSGRTMLDKVVTNSETLEFNFVSNNAFSPHGPLFGLIPSYEVFIDPAWVTTIDTVRPDGTGYSMTLEQVVIHELVHAIDNLSDPSEPESPTLFSFYRTPDDYAGDTVLKTTAILNELGVNNTRVSYAGADLGPNSAITPGTNYTNGNNVDVVLVGGGLLDTSGMSVSSDDLLMGRGSGANEFLSGRGNDYLYGNAGDDELNGGAGNDFIDGGTGTDTVVYTGRCADYNVTANADASFTIRDTRPGSPDGTDTVTGAEIVRFSDGDGLFQNGALACPGSNVILAIDVSGSMRDDIAAVKVAANQIVDQIFGPAAAPIASRFGIITFNDTGALRVELPFTDQQNIADRKAAAFAAIQNVSILGGGAEPLNGALLSALNGDAGTWNTNATSNRIVVFTDEPAADPLLRPLVIAKSLFLDVDVGQTAATSSTPSSNSSIIEELWDVPVPQDDERLSVQILPVAIGSSSSTRNDLQELADATGGQLFTAANASEVADAILEAVSIPAYSISSSTSSIVEGDTGETLVEFTVSRDVAENASVVDLSISGTVDTGDIGPTPAQVLFEVGEFSVSFSVPVNGDRIVENNESLQIQILSVSETASFSTQPAVVVIENDDEDVNVIEGTEGRDNLSGTEADDAIRSLGGSYDKMSGDAGADQFIFSDEATNGIRERDVILDYEVGIDSIVLEGSASVGSIRETSSSVVIFLEGDRDAIYVRGDGVTADNLSIITNDLFV